MNEFPMFRWPADQNAVEARLAPDGAALPASVVDDARRILAQVRERGDAALIELTEQLDGVALTPERLAVSADDIATSAHRAPPALREAIDLAIENVRRFHEPQRREDYAIPGPGGGTLRMLWRPVASAALYVPGGRAAYPSSVVMNAVPALVAGVPRIAVFTVPGMVESNPAVAYALQALGLTEVYRVAGAQAIAAATYCTDVIVGPGNAWVAAAKREVYGLVGIDSIAGPSEVLIVADDSADPRWVARDLLAQAEHDPLARCVLASTSVQLIDAVRTELAALVEASPRREIVEAALRDHGLALHVDGVDDLVALAARMAPEHLQVMLREPPPAQVWVAGAVFMGGWAPTALGDYIAGPNHVLPTGGSARFAGPLSVDTFVRPMSVIEGDEGMARTLCEHGAVIADYEALAGHADALRSRVARGEA